MTEEKKHDTTSKRDVIFAWLDEHHEPGMTAHAVSKGAGVGFDTAKKWFAVWGSGGVDDVDETDTEADDVDEPVEAVDEDAAEVDDDDDNVTVSRAYLLTLEALRDQVLETQRLRRMLEAR